MASITLDKTTIKAGETAVVTFTVEKTHFMGTLNGHVRDATVTGGTISGGYDFRYIEALSSPTTQVYQGIFTPTANLDRTECTITYDAPGTANDATSAVFIVDTRAPTLTGTPTIGNPNLTRANQVTTISFVFSEQLNQASFTTADLTIPAGMGTLENLRTTDGGRSWQVDLRAPANLAANTEAKNLQIGINMTGITDVAGNPGTGNVNLATYTIDNKPPSATITVTPNPVTSSNDRLVTVTITFDEAVTGFTVDNIDFSNAHVTPYGTGIGTLNRSADGRTYTITYTAGPDVEDDTNTISLRNLNTIRDAVDNAATVSPTSNNYVIDTKDPRVASITVDKTHLTAGDTATITVTFNESVSGFTEAAIQIANGSVSNLRPVAGTDGRVWTATFTPTANLARTSVDRIEVRLDGITDRIGNNSSGTEARDIPAIVIDTKVFVVNAATVNGKQLVLQYSDETRLDPDQTHNAPNDAFVVLVDGVRNSVTGVVVDAAAKTVTLTLERAVSKGQQVSVAYNDPSTGDDPQAVQEATTGKDAASFAAKPVTNLTPAPPAPEAPDAGAPDSDRDGLSNNREDQAPGLLRPDGSAGLAGDGNGDGVKDSQQVAVASTRDLTLVAGSRDGKLIPDSNARITELVRSDAPATLPKGMEMPLGLTSFKVSLAEGRSTESFSLYVDQALGANGYWLKNGAGTWVNLASEPYGGKVSSEGGRTRLDFQIQDGGQYDADGQADGSITAPGAVAKMPLSIVGQSAQVESHGFWF
ncbi:Ig-like domain-containing protein [Verminephrobacter eiseniae]|uniref:Ig-like domain-containing protein n=1 Tax=Verminephrobacter eiseniae TaxID=364317 RepID=UPI00223786D1|nr:Ig-like domain-containing protein [Verminephrobacter eiseniae]MCW5231929.1 hypothetical protein [Verminephrobacter eiseniae]MCW5293662.1 hypothetical protein [Verminephrobacter eiseniae]MCW8184319.1 hypothetical protein [Verminephrobacter eiseniae]MCW8225042.1 hypothetical protein [Verminephrobacter eiseniae]MCW8233334.1 hypothetical protein [Verminephrobacter eiseniae]